MGTVLAVYNWPIGTERYRNVAHFVETFFGRLGELRMSRHHPKWREINIHDSVAGWTRFEPASQWIKSAERVSKNATRFVGDLPAPAEGSTTSAAMPSAGSGDMEPSNSEAAVNYANSGSAQFRGRVSLDEGQRDALFREFLEYQKRGAQGAGDNPTHNEALFAEFQSYVNHLLQQPDRPLTGAKR